jgi:hypothetical protein
MKYVHVASPLSVRWTSLDLEARMAILCCAAALDSVNWKDGGRNGVYSLPSIILMCSTWILFTVVEDVSVCTSCDGITVVMGGVVFGGGEHCYCRLKCSKHVLT